MNVARTVSRGMTVGAQRRYGGGGVELASSAMSVSALGAVNYLYATLIPRWHQEYGFCLFVLVFFVFLTPPICACVDPLKCFQVCELKVYESNGIDKLLE